MIYVVFTAHSKGLVTVKYPQISNTNPVLIRIIPKPYVISKAPSSC